MQITVFGANGKVGRLVVNRLLQDGHTVTAFVHSHMDLAASPKLQIIQGDIYSSDDITAALHGSDAVISALGSWHTPQKNILSSAMERLIPAMRTANIKRIVTVTGAGAQMSHDQPTLFEQVNHALLNATAPKILRDGEDHIKLLEESKLDWTVVRSPIMNESGSKEYRLGGDAPTPWKTIHRQAVAHCLTTLAQNTNYCMEAPFITRP